MKERILAVCAVAALACSSTSAYASGSSGNTQVSEVRVEGSEIFLVLGASSNPDGCDVGTTVKLSGSSDAIEKMLSASLTAASQHLTVRVWLSGCASTSWGYSAPLATTITVYFQ